MNFKEMLINFFTFFGITLAVSVVITLLWELIFHGKIAVDWSTSFRLAIILGFILSWMKAQEEKKK